MRIIFYFGDYRNFEELSFEENYAGEDYIVVLLMDILRIFSRNFILQFRFNFFVIFFRLYVIKNIMRVMLNNTTTLSSTTMIYSFQNLFFKRLKKLLNVYVSSK